MSKLESIRGEMIFDYVEGFRKLALTHLSKNKFNEAALIIHRFQFKEGFDIKMIIDRLVDSNKI